MKLKDCCLTCKFWKPKPHQGWKPISNLYNSEYELMNLRKYIVDSGLVIKDWNGECQIAPEWRPTTAQHSCNWHKLNPDLILDWYDYQEVYRLRKDTIEQKAEIKRLTGVLKELRAKRRAEQQKQQKPKEPPSVAPEA